MTLLIVLVAAILLIQLVSALLLFAWMRAQQQTLNTQIQKLAIQFETHSQAQKPLYEHITTLLTSIQNAHQTQQSQFQQYQLNSLNTQQQTLEKGMREVRAELVTTLTHNARHSNDQLKQLSEVVHQRLQDISQQVEKRLTVGFEKTTTLFSDVVKRLALIDAAQQRITELSSSVVSLQDILKDKRARGAFGEVQLASLVKNTLPEQHVKLQHTLSNGKRVDCLLLLPEPTGNLAIDAKFPLEGYQKLHTADDEHTKKAAAAQFRQDIRKHIQDVSSKYRIPGETADGAILFIPAESVFAEIHTNYLDIVEYAHNHKIWLVSPSTMMAILTTSLAVLKDVATRKQVNIIQEHLSLLNQDFARFQKRMDALAKHINQANTDIEQVHISSKKISQRFQKIEQVELNENLQLEEPVE